MATHPTFMTRGRRVVLAACALLLAAPVLATNPAPSITDPATATSLVELTTSAPVVEQAPAMPLFELLSLFVGGETAAKWVAVLGLVAWLLTQIMAWLPPAWLAKCPPWLLSVIQAVAGNYRRAANETAGNPQSSRDGH